MFFIALCSADAPAQEVCDEFDKLVTTTPTPPPTVGAWNLHRAELTSAPRGNIDVLLLGDSLAQLWDGRLWAPKDVANFGVGGDDTQRVLWRLSAPQLKQLKPRRVLIILGTNSLGVAKPCAIGEGLKAVIERTRKLWPAAKIYFLEIPPKGPSFTYKNDDRTAVNSFVRQIRGVKTINADDAVTCGWKESCENYEADKVHFTEAGYRTLLQIVRPAIFGK